MLVLYEKATDVSGRDSLLNYTNTSTSVDKISNVNWHIFLHESSYW